MSIYKENYRILSYIIRFTENSISFFIHYRVMDTIFAIFFFYRVLVSEKTLDADYKFHYHSLKSPAKNSSVLPKSAYHT